MFCCASILPFRPARLLHEDKFVSFMKWANYPASASKDLDPTDLQALQPLYAVQLVRQVNYGALESKRYFIPYGSGFKEVTEDDLIQGNFEKLNT